MTEISNKTSMFNPMADVMSNVPLIECSNPINSIIIPKETMMSKLWPFLAGVAVGATGIVVAACVVDNYANGDTVLEGNFDADDEEVSDLQEPLRADEDYRSSE